MVDSSPESLNHAACRSIYSAIVEGHLNQGGFEAGVAKLGPKLVDATLELHRSVMNNFLPSAVKFHYQFNLRELSSISQVGCFIRPEHAAVRSCHAAREDLLARVTLCTCPAEQTCHAAA